MPWNKTDLKCPICGKSILERDGFYRCEDYIDADHGCKFRIGKIKGKAIPIKQIEKLIKENSTDVIKGFVMGKFLQHHTDIVVKIIKHRKNVGKQIAVLYLGTLWDIPLRKKNFRLFLMEV